MSPSRIIRIVFLGVLVLLCFSCTETKDLSEKFPYNRSIGEKFILKEDLYIFCDYDSSQLSIAGPHAGIIGLPPLVNEKYFEDDYFGKKNRYLKHQKKYFFYQQPTFDNLMIITNNCFFCLNNY